MISAFFLPALFAFHTLTPARADVPALTLEQAVREAMERNPQLQSSRAASGQASWKPLEALSGNLPKLTLGANHFFNLKYQIISLNLGGTPASFPAVYPQTALTLD